MMMKSLAIRVNNIDLHNGDIVVLTDTKGRKTREMVSLVDRDGEFVQFGYKAYRTENLNIELFKRGYTAWELESKEMKEVA